MKFALQPKIAKNTLKPPILKVQGHSRSPMLTMFKSLSPVLVMITACAIATSCCISDVPSQWEDQNFDPPQLPHFSTDFNEPRKISGI